MTSVSYFTLRPGSPVHPDDPADLWVLGASDSELNCLRSGAPFEGVPPHKLEAEGPWDSLGGDQLLESNGLTVLHNSVCDTLFKTNSAQVGYPVALEIGDLTKPKETRSSELRALKAASPALSYAAIYVPITLETIDLMRSEWTQPRRTLVFSRVVFRLRRPPRLLRLNRKILFSEELVEILRHAKDLTFDVETGVTFELKS